MQAVEFGLPAGEHVHPVKSGPPAGGRANVGAPVRRDAGMLSLEAVAMLPILALLMFGLLETAAVIRDVLVVHEAARAGVRTAATTSGTDAPVQSAHEAAPELELNVAVEPASRSDGDLVTVTTSAQRSIGPFTHTVRAEAVAVVEPAVGSDMAHSQSAGTDGGFGVPP